ncbi:MAG: hypothetical protein Q4D57_00670 [Clostridia bacterium]|nr:hypothetical protein [Clostridia bacterium]
MSNYFKIKRPFVSKTDKLPEGDIKNLAQSYRGIEKNCVKVSNCARDCKVALKKCSPVQQKLAKEQNEDKKTKLNEQLSKLKDKYIDCYLKLLEYFSKMAAEITPQLQVLADAEKTFFTPTQLNKIQERIAELEKNAGKAGEAAKEAEEAAKDAEKEAEQILEAEGESNQ